MSDTYSQQAFGQPTFTDAHASGSSSGRDLFDIIDASNLYHDAQYPPGDQSLQPLRIRSHDQYAQSQHFAHALQNSGVSVTDIQYTSPTIPNMNSHIPQIFEPDSTMHFGLDDLQGFSAVTQGYNINVYRTPYPDSNATSTSSATSPDPTNATLLTDPVVVEAEEDKRKRNQAASARFRQKKKQREQHLMERSQEMQEKAKKLEAENDGLKKENLFLKKLLVEKVDHMSDEDRDLLRKAAEGTLDRMSGKKS
ncbi:regulatory protein cys-3 [Stemphylium lycopersici]|uniref:Regulatory protein cys-3 n=1 Tax=Stemphylium lycopersici TaxID=183478 RepID=A0A364N3K8_STELY|nr:regulatory protein cys-3 [Stemphylium lycopersici]RAR11043.1 regulatory protein cys-3 [Stemphylium lycopersici]